MLESLLGVFGFITEHLKDRAEKKSRARLLKLDFDIASHVQFGDAITLKARNPGERRVSLEAPKFFIVVRGPSRRFPFARRGKVQYHAGVSLSKIDAPPFPADVEDGKSCTVAIPFVDLLAQAREMGIARSVEIEARWTAESGEEFRARYIVGGDLQALKENAAAAAASHAAEVARVEAANAPSIRWIPFR